MNIAQRLREVRTSQKLTQEQFADKIKYARNTVMCWETGRRLPGSDAISSIATQFNVSSDYLLGLTDTPHPIAN